MRAVLVSCCGCLLDSFCGCLFCSCLCDLCATSGGVHCIRCGVCSRSFLCNSVCAVCSCSCLCALCAVCSRSFLCIVIVVCSSSCLCVWCAVFSCSFLCRGGLFVPAVFSAVGGVLVAILAFSFSVGWLSVSCVGVSRFHGEAPLGVSLRRGGGWEHVHVERERHGEGLRLHISQAAFFFGQERAFFPRGRPGEPGLPESRCPVPRGGGARLRGSRRAAFAGA